MTVAIKPIYQVVIFPPLSENTVPGTVIRPVPGGPHIDEFRVTTVQNGPDPRYKPYLEIPKARSAKFDAMTKELDIGDWTFDVNNPRVGDDNAVRWVDAFIGNGVDDQRIRLQGCRVVVRRSYDNGATWPDPWVGRIDQVNTTDPNRTTFHAFDINKDLDGDLFASEPSGAADISLPTILPIGRTRDWNGLPGLTTAQSTWWLHAGIGSAANSRRVRTHATVPGFLEAVSSASAMWIATKALCSGITRDSSTSPLGQRAISVNPGLRFRFIAPDNPLLDGKMAAVIGGVVLPGQNGSGPRLVEEMTIQSLDSADPYYIDVNGAELGAEGAAVQGYIYAYDSATASGDRTVLVRSKGAVQHLRDICNGYYSRRSSAGADPVLTIDFDEESFAAVEAVGGLPNFSWIVEEAQKAREWITTQILQPAGLAYWMKGVWDENGTDPQPRSVMSLIDMRPASVANRLFGLQTINDSSLVAGKHPQLDAKRAEAAPIITVTSYTDVELDPATQFTGSIPEVKSTMLGDPIENTTVDVSPDLSGDLGQKKFDMDVKGFRNAYLFGQTQPTGADIDALARAAATIYEHPFARGPVFVTANFVVGSPADAIAKIGAWCYLSFSAALNFGTSGRGGSRLSLCLDRQEDKGEITCRFLDFGEVESNVDVPPAPVPHPPWILPGGAGDSGDGGGTWTPPAPPPPTPPRLIDGGIAFPKPIGWEFPTGFSGSLLNPVFDSVVGLPSELASATVRVVPVDLTVTDRSVEVQMAFTDPSVTTAPDATSPLWQLTTLSPRPEGTPRYAAAYSSGTWFTIPVRDGVRVWLRDRTTGIVPSAWSTAAYVDVDAPAAPTGVSVTDVTSRSARVTWVVGDAALPIEVVIESPDPSPTMRRSIYAPAGSTSIVIDSLDTDPAVTHKVSVAHHSATGISAYAAVEFSTLGAATAPTAPSIGGIRVTSSDLGIPPTSGTSTGIELSITPGQVGVAIEIEEAPDLSGAPDLANAATLITLPAASAGPNGARFLDELPLNGIRRWYRARHVSTVSLPGGYTDWVSGVPVVIQLNGTTSDTSLIAGIVGVDHGGTGVAGVTPGSLLIGEGTAPFGELDAGANGGYVRSQDGSWTRHSGIPLADITGLIVGTHIDPALIAATVGRANSNLTVPMVSGTSSGSLAATFGRSCLIHRVTAERACRVRVYGSPADLAADASRPVGTDPADGTGVLLDVVLTASLLSLWLSPMAVAANNDATNPSQLSVLVDNTPGTSFTSTLVTFDTTTLVP